MTDFVEMFRHWNAGRSQVQINEALGIDRKTIRKYLAPALAEGLTPGPESRSTRRCGGRGSAGGFPSWSTRRLRALTWPQIAAHHQWIADQLKVPVTVATIAQRLRDDHGVEVSESTVRRYIATTFAEERLEEQGDRAARCGRAGQRSPDRLRQARDVVRPGQSGAASRCGCS